MLFRIDTYEAPDGAPLYSCLVSKDNPAKAKVFNRFIVRTDDRGFRIHARFTLSDNGMGGTPKWFFRSGDRRYQRIVESEHDGRQYLLDEASLGRRVAIERLTEPVATDTHGLAEYHRD